MGTRSEISSWHVHMYVDLCMRSTTSRFDSFCVFFLLGRLVRRHETARSRKVSPGGANTGNAVTVAVNACVKATARAILVGDLAAWQGLVNEDPEIALDTFPTRRRLISDGPCAEPGLGTLQPNDAPLSIGGYGTLCNAKRKHGTIDMSPFCQDL